MNNIYPDHVYRPDIDGLRAVAVLAVVGFHAAPGRLPGGFIGVDIFFVISGYLISLIVLKDLKEYKFNIFDFYQRRIRRIFPALIIILASSCIFGNFVLLADEYNQLGKHIASGAVFVSNFILQSESGYFDKTAEVKPLLHLWSLGIEEQFYIFWPLLLHLAWRRRVNIPIIFISIIIASFAFNVHKANSDMVSAFYSPLTRFWEITIGSAVAYYHLSDSNIQNGCNLRFKNLVSSAGVALIFLGFFILSTNHLFPGWWALIPTIGASLLIMSRGAWINKFVLSNGVLVWFGLISFPLYLWHWPILSFIRIIYGAEVPQSARVLAVLASIVLAWVTYEMIEKPIRARFYSKLLIGVLVFLMLLVGSTGYYIQMRSGLVHLGENFPKIVNIGDIGHSTFFEQQSQKYFPCTPQKIRDEADRWNEYIRCYQSKSSDRTQIAILGDSHAEALFPGMAEELNGVNIVAYNRVGMPLISNGNFRHIIEYLVADNSISIIIISSKWHLSSQTESLSIFESDLKSTVSLLTASGKKVYLVEDVPEFLFSPAICKYANRLWMNNRCVQENGHSQLANTEISTILRSLEGMDGGVKFVEVRPFFCNQDFCKMAKDGTLLYRDNHHLNINGSIMLGRYIVSNNPEFKSFVDR